MAPGSGAGVTHQIDADARKTDQLGGEVNFLATPERKPFQPISAELIGSDTCSGAGITVRAAAPVLELCRELIKAGHDPRLPLWAYRGNTLALIVTCIGAGAKLTVKTMGNGAPGFTVEGTPGRATAPPMRTTNGGAL